MRNGSERVVNSVREHYYDIEPLETYECIDEKGKDQGVNVRQKSKEIRELIMDDDLLREELSTCKVGDKIYRLAL